MKYYYYLILAALFLGLAVNAEEVPEYMRDGVITVTLKSGKTYTYSLNEYKVVRRWQAAEETEEAVEHHHRKHVEQHPAEHSRNRIAVHSGVGPDGLKAAAAGNDVTVSQRYRALIGVSYSRKLDDRFSLQGTYLSNDTLTLGLGYDF